ncbi:MAG: hypothetical protein Q8L86_11230 [Vicinamibacterales bacterium]|nr:hypothetical protein [Vicinamibacterales bacterium]
MRHSPLQRAISAMLIVPFVLATTLPANAQTAGQAPAAAPATTSADQGDTLAAGLVDGEMLAERVGTGSKLGTGLAVGVFTGFIGTGIGYFAMGPEGMTPEAYQRYANRGPEYQMGFKTGWERKTRARKRNAFLAGGLLGTAAFLAIVLSANAGE